MGTPKPLNTTTLMCIKHILRRNILCFNNLQKLSLTFILLFKYFSSSFLHLSSMMPRNVVADHSSKELLLHMLTPFTTPPQDGQHHPSTLWVRRRCQHSSCHRHWSSSHSAFSLVLLCGSHLSLSQPASSLVFLCGSHYFVDFLICLHTLMDCTLHQISNKVIPIESFFKLNYIGNFN